MLNAFETFGYVLDKLKSWRFRTAHIPKDIGRTEESIESNQFTSIRHRTQELDLTSTIMHEDLNLKAYKISLVQKLVDSVHQRCRNYYYWLLDQSGEKYEVCQTIIMSDEVPFHLNGAVNSQNCRIWGT